MNGQNEKPELVTVQHPWRGVTTVSLGSTMEWINAWNMTASVEMRLGLLHALTLNSRCWYDKWEQIVSFLLEVADGYRTESNFSDPGQDSCSWRDRPDEIDVSHMSVSRQRQLIAEKAFQILCLKVFRRGDKESFRRHPQWTDIIYSDGLFRRILWFLRRGNDRWSTDELHNSRLLEAEKRTPIQAMFADFLEEFSKLGWTLEDHKSRYSGQEIRDDEVRKRLIEARPLFMRILRSLGMLGWLVSRELNDACLNELSEMALKEERWLHSEVDGSDTRRLPRDLSEAVMAGSKPAQVLLLYRIKMQGTKKVQALRDKRRKEMEHQRLLEEKRALEKQQQELDQAREHLKEQLGK